MFCRRKKMSTISPCTTIYIYSAAFFALPTTYQISLLPKTDNFDHIPKVRKVEAEITCMLLFPLVRPHPRPTPLFPKERVSLNFKCDITYRILVGSGGGVSSNGATPKTSLQSSVQSSSAFAMIYHERQTHEARERVLASQKDRICGTTSLTREGPFNVDRYISAKAGQFVLGGKAKGNFPDIARGMNGLRSIASPSLQQPSSSLSQYDDFAMS